MKINRKFLKRVQLSTSPRKSIQHIRKCYMEGGILQENNEVTETILSPKERKIHLREMRKNYASMMSVGRVQSKYPTLVRPIINTEMCSTNSSSPLSFEELRQQIIDNSCYPLTLNEVFAQFSIDSCVIPKSPTLGLTFTYRMPAVSSFVYGVTT